MKSTDSFPIYVINLERSQDRRARITHQLEKLGLQYTLFSAVDGKSLSEEELSRDYDPITTLAVMGRQLSLGEIGCSLSHIGVYRDLIESKAPYALILEDDAELAETLPKALAALAQVLSPQDNRVYLLNQVHRYTLWNHKKLPSVGKLCPIIESYCANGYVVTRKSAEILLQNLYPVNQVADNWNTLLKLRTLKIVGLIPYVVGLYNDHAVQSNIEGREELMSPLKKRGLKPYLKKMLYRKFAYQIFIKPLFRIKKQKSLNLNQRELTPK